MVFDDQHASISTTKKSLFSLPLALALLFGAGVGAHAADITFDVTSGDGSLTISANDFEQGISANGMQFQSGLSNPQSTTILGPAATSISGTWLGGPGTGGISRTIYLVSATNSTLVDDIWDYSISYTLTGVNCGFLCISLQNAGVLSGTFTAGAAGGGGIGSLPAGVDPADVFTAGDTITFSGTNLTGRILSQAPQGPTAMPEPASLALFGLGIAALATIRRRQPKV